MEEIVSNILTTISASLTLALIVLYGIYLIIYILKTNKLRQEYIKTLNEHDKSVVMDYKNTFWSLKDAKKHNKSN